MSYISDLWGFLSQDVALLGGPHSPVLSWLGSLGIIVFFSWQVARLKKEIIDVREKFEGLFPLLSGIIKDRGKFDGERFLRHPKQGSRQQDRLGNTATMRIDSDDLQTLDAGMEKEPMFHGPWAQYRMTLILENVPWFMEPRIFSTKRAEEIFTRDRLIANRVNLSFYSQFPSLVTGIGLLFTFIALFIGLGKLHADGSEIVGIQGLINGLAGKFLTSIVGLIVANMFTFIERPLVSQLMNVHQTFLGMVDQLFPRKTMEEILEQLTIIDGDRRSTPLSNSTIPRGHHSRVDTSGLAGSMANLTAVIQSLQTAQQEEQEETRHTVSTLPRSIREELQSPLRELTDTIHDLTKILKDAQPILATVESPFEQRPLLWKEASDVMDPSATIRTRKSRSWLRWPRLSRLRRTG